MENDHKSGIYAIHHIDSGKVYVGSAVSFKRRRAEHLKRLRNKYHENGKLQRAWDKYGEGSFVFSVLEYVENKIDLIIREQHWIEKLNAASRDNYNISPTAGSSLGVKHTAEARANMAAAWKPMTPEAREKARASNTGKKRTPEVKAMLSAAAKKRPPMSAETREKVSAGKKNPSAEYRARLSAIRKGRVSTLSAVEARVKKMSLAKAEEIRALYASKSYTYNELAEMYNITAGSVSRVITKKRWAKDHY